MSTPAAIEGRSEGEGVLEVADIRVKPGQGAEFEQALQRAVQTVLVQARGYRSCEVRRGIESPERFLLLIRWDSLENHTVDFRQGPLFASWRALIGPFFAEPPAVEHFARSSVFA